MNSGTNNVLCYDMYWCPGLLKGTLQKESWYLYYKKYGKLENFLYQLNILSDIFEKQEQPH